MTRQTTAPRALVVGSTGFTPESSALLAESAKAIPIFFSAP